ncbi:hypothetical protein [Emticicia oligotrophica]|uniref:hypothetical protein n=1 Tax=Emticicia oligotrophica TaxID=312279 RepID=UPI0035B61A8D
MYAIININSYQKKSIVQLNFRKKEITKKNLEKGLIQIQVYLYGKRRHFSTKIYVTPKNGTTRN